MISGDNTPPPVSPGGKPAKNEVVQADLAAIDERVFRGSGNASLDDQLAALREVALNILGGTDG